MESNKESGFPTSPENAAAALEALGADRERLAQRVSVPWALMVALGLVAGWWVGSAAFSEPGAGYRTSPSAWLTLPAAFVVLYLVRRESGVRFGALGARANGAFACIVVLCLLLFSASLALVSLDLRWLVAATTLVAIGMTTWLAGVAYRAAVERMRRG